MSRAAEAAAFVALAAGLHLGLWSLAPQLPDAAGGGGGPMPVSLAPASAQQAALARAWSTPPERSEAEALRPAPPESPSESAPEPPASLPARNLSPPPAPRLPALPLLPPAPPRAEALSAPLATMPAAATAPIAAPQPSRAEARRPPAPHPPRESAQDAARGAPAPPAPRPAAPPAPEPAARADTSPPSPRPAASPSPGTTASGGEKNAARAGNGGKGALPNATGTAATRQLQAQWGARILRRIHRRLIYPRGASGTGTARIGLTVERSGRLVALRLLRSSGNARFDRAALAAARRAGRFPAAPEGLDRARYDFALSLTFRP